MDLSPAAATDYDSSNRTTRVVERYRVGHIGDTNLNFEFAAVKPDFYAWEPPGKDVSIQIHFDVVDRLLADVMRGFGAVPRRGAEVGGILLGSAVLSDRLLVRIEDFEPIECDYRRGPSYLLSAEENQRLEASIEAQSPGADRQIYAVGFYRSHTREGLGLSPEDLELFERHFKNPTDIALLVKPFAARVSVGGFFFREGRQMQSEASWMEFPFRRQDLGGGQPRPSRDRQETRTLMEKDETEVNTQFAEPATGVAPLARALADEPALDDKSLAPLLDPPKLKRGNVWIPLSFIFLILGVLLGFQSALGTRSHEAAVPAEDPYLLDLTARKEGGALHVKWSAKAPIVKKSRHATISIVDGDYRNTVDLDSTDLQSGNLLYRNLTGVVKLRFDVYASDRTCLSETLEYRAESAEPAKK